MLANAVGALAIFAALIVFDRLQRQASQVRVRSRTFMSSPG
jgi:hypothetical protein